VTVRIGIVDAAGWSGIAPQDAAAIGARCAGAGLQVELWTHITSATRRSDALRAFAACVSAFAASGATIAGTDVASTAWASAGFAGTRMRIGAGLFGARLGAGADLRCAIRVDAPVVDWFAPGTLDWAGYGDVAIPADRGVAILRCGYGDGLPKKLAGDDDILSVGMQYTIRLADNPSREHALIDHRSDLDQLADRLDVGPHELITGLAQHT
jgi:alanine racemase